MVRTVEDAQRWAAENSAQLDADRNACPDGAVRMLNRLLASKSKSLWDTGCWLQHELRALGATEGVIQSIQFAAGQRALFGDPWQVVVDYVNEYAATGDTVEKGGAELAEKINGEVFD